MANYPQISLPVDIRTMGQKVGVMIRRAVQALLEADAKLAESVLEMDDEIDEMNRAVQAELIEVMQQHPLVAEQSLNAIIISRNPRTRRRPTRRISPKTSSSSGCAARMCGTRSRSPARNRLPEYTTAMHLTLSESEFPVYLRFETSDDGRGVDALQCGE